MIAIKSYTNGDEAYIAKTLIENFLIRCELKDDLISAQSIREIKLFVNVKYLATP